MAVAGYGFPKRGILPVRVGRQQVKMRSKGRLDFVASGGQYVQCSVFDKNGSLVKKGDLLARQDTDLPTSDLKIAKAELARAKAVLKEKTLNLERDAKLSKREAVSARQFQETQMLYDTALIDTQKAELAVKRATQVLDACYIWTPFNAFIEERIPTAPGKAANAGGVAVSGLEMSQNSERLSWSREEVDKKLHYIMNNIHDNCVKYGTEPDGYINYVKGANIAGFLKVAKAMMAQGVF